MSADLQLALFAPPVTAERGPALFLSPLPRGLPAAGVRREALVHGVHLECFLRRSARARSVRLLVDRRGLLTVVVPTRFPLREVPDALAEHAAWIARTVERQRRHPRTRLTVTDGARLTVLGVEHLVRIASDPPLGSPARVHREGSTLHVSVPPLHAASAAELLRTWLRALATREIPRHVERVEREIGLNAARVSVRDQRTKWGACSARAHLSFSWRLVLAPVEVLDYVVVHELCHVRELNHSPRFWRLVRRARPDFERWRAWLRDQGEWLDL